MTITRVQLETELVARRRAMMEAAGLAVTFAGSNNDLVSPMSYAIRQSGGTLASLSNVTDADLATVDQEDYDKLMDLAEYRLLRNIKGRWAKVDISSGPFSQSWSQLADQLDADIAAMKEQLEEEYGFGGSSSIEVGVIDFNFQQTNPDEGL